MRRLFPLVSLLVAGCSDITYQAPPDPLVQLIERSNDAFKDWTAKSNAAQNQFLACVPIYAASYGKTRLTPTELAEAAISACRPPLNDFQAAQQNLWILAGSNNPSRDAAPVIAQTVDAARGLVFRQIAESAN